MNTYLPDQSVSDKQKLKEEWYVPTYDYWIEKCIGLKSGSDVLTMIRAANGEIDDTDLQYLVKPFNEDAVELNAKYPYGFRDTDIITPIVEKIVGEYIELPYRFMVKFHDPDISTMQDHELKAMIERILKEALAEKLKQDEESQQESTSQDIAALIDKKKAEFVANEALKAKRFLQYVNEKLDFDYYRYQMFYNWWTTEECYVYRTIDKGDFEKVVISPQDGYPYNNNNDFVDDCIAFVWTEHLSWDEFIMNHKDELSPNQIREVEELVSGTNYGAPVIAPIEMITNRTKYDWYRVSSETQIDSELTTADKTIKKYNVVFQAYRKVQTLRYIDNITGEEKTTTVPKDYKLNEAYGDIEIKSSTISESWQGARFGNENIGFYTKPVKHIVQREGKIPVTGKQFTLKNKKVNPIPYRLMVYQAIDRMIFNQIEKTMAQFKGDILLMPKSILADDKAGDAKQKTFYMLKDNRIVYDDTRVEMQSIVQGFRIVQGSTTDRYITILVDLQKHYRGLANEIASMNQDRLGNIDTRGGVNNVEQNIYRSKLGSVLSLEVFRKILEKEHEADLEYAKYLFIDGVDDTMFDEDGNVVQININGYANFKRSFGVHIENGLAIDRKLNQIREMAISASQNGQFDGGIAAIKSDNIEEIEDAINKIKQATENFEREKEAMQTEREQMQIQAADEMRAAALEDAKELATHQSELKINEIITTKEYELTKEAMSEESNESMAAMDADTAQRSNETRERIANAQGQIARESKRADERIAKSKAAKSKVK